MSIRHFSSKLLPTAGQPGLGRVLAGSTLVALASAFALASTASAAPTFEVLCNTGGDQFGYSIASNGDYNGDGINDLAVGAPCHHVGDNPRAGRVLVLSGANGRRLLSRNGFQTGMWLGSSVTFIPDINGDGRDELAVGSPGYTVTQDDNPEVGRNGLLKAGRVDVWQRKSRRLKLFGVTANSGFGEQIAPAGDVNGDGRTDFVIAASRDQKIDGGDRPGRLYMVSGRNGEFLQIVEGPKNGKRYGQTLVTAGDVTGDGIDDILAGSKDVNIFNVRRAGVVDTLDALDLSTDVYRVVGAKADGIGRSIAAAGDVDGDGIPDFITGSDRSDDEGVKGTGLVTLFSLDGRRIWTSFDPELQEAEEFGTAVATLDDFNADGVTDFVASATGFDVFVVDRFRDDVGRVLGLSGQNGDVLWTVDGQYSDQRFGFTLATIEDQDKDHGSDFAVGSIGDYPLGRRGAGSVQFRSSTDGRLLRTFAGRRGLETRIMAAGPIRASAGRVRSFNHRGFSRELSAVVLDGVEFGDFSVTVVNDVGRPRPGVVQAVVGTGTGTTSSQVEVYSVGRRRNQVDSFEAFPNLTDTGVNCGAGELDGEINENLVCTQADSEDGNVVARILRRLDEEEPFFPILEFPVFSSEDILNNTIDINAGGATVASGDVLGGSGDEIIVGTTSGVPFVKVFNNEGRLLTSFLAYDPVLYSGVDVAVVDMDGGGEKEIVTVPRSGPALIKAFKGNGTRVTYGREQLEVSILASSLAFTGGGRVAGADVDLDTIQEIIFMRQEADGTRLVRAFERDGTEVSTDYFKPFDPFPESTLLGGDIDGTDLFVRN